MTRNRAVMYSLISGCVWAVIGLGIGWSVSAIRSTLSDVGRTFAGGFIAAPLIGVLVGVLSRGFNRRSRPARIMIALGDLYLAVWLFLLATNLAKVLGEDFWLVPFRTLVSAPILGAVLGLTYTGFFVLLWPLSYVNHLVIAREWSRNGAASDLAA